MICKKGYMIGRKAKKLIFLTWFNVVPLCDTKDHLKSLNVTFDIFICRDLLKSYKFYLAFENSWCNDYVTEKLWRTLKTDTVPIVLGGANYSGTQMLLPFPLGIEFSIFDND